MARKGKGRRLNFKFKIDPNSLAGRVDAAAKKVKWIADKAFGSVAGLIGKLTAPISAIGGVLLAQEGAYREQAGRIRRLAGESGAVLEASMGAVAAIRTTSGFAFEDATTAVASLQQAFHLSGSALREVSSSMATFARDTGAPMETAVSSAIDVMRAFGVDGSSATGVLQTLRAGALDAKLGLPQFAGALKLGAPVFRQLGLGLNQSVVMLSGFSAHGVTADISVQGLQMALAKLAQDGDDLTQKFYERVEAIRTAPTELDASRLAFDLFGESALKMGEAIRRGAVDWPAIKAGNVKIKDSSTSISLLSWTFQAEWAKLEEAFRPIGKPLYDACLGLVRIADTVVGWLGQATQWFASLPTGVQDAIVALGAFVAIIGPAMAVAAAIAANVGRFTIAAIKTVGAFKFAGIAVGISMVGTFAAWQASLEAAKASLLKGKGDVEAVAKSAQHQLSTPPVIEVIGDIPNTRVVPDPEEVVESVTSVWSGWTDPKYLMGPVVYNWFAPKYNFAVVYNWSTPVYNFSPPVYTWSTPTYNFSPPVYTWMTPKYNTAAPVFNWYTPTYNMAAPVFNWRTPLHGEAGSGAPAPRENAPEPPKYDLAAVWSVLRQSQDPAIKQLLSGGDASGLIYMLSVKSNIQLLNEQQDAVLQWLQKRAISTPSTVQQWATQQARISAYLQERAITTPSTVQQWVAQQYRAERYMTELRPYLATATASVYDARLVAWAAARALAQYEGRAV